MIVNDIAMNKPKDILILKVSIWTSVICTYKEKKQTVRNLLMSQVSSLSVVALHTESALSLE